MLIALLLASALVTPLLAHAESESDIVPSMAQAFLDGAPNEDSQPVSKVEDHAGYTQLKVAEEDNRRFLALCIMGTAIMALAFVLAILHKQGASPESIVAGSGLVLVIFATILIATLAKTDQQLTAPIGILGAIAGYLFGKTARGTESDQKSTKVAGP
ncbi:MAG: hypothetical protein OEY28_09355 [Nitrospira sp.]|nr:hypothetical protein [Nitrospira sp.]